MPSPALVVGVSGTLPPRGRGAVLATSRLQKLSVAQEVRAAALPASLELVNKESEESTAAGVSGHPAASVADSTEPASVGSRFAPLAEEEDPEPAVSVAEGLCEPCEEDEQEPSHEDGASGVAECGSGVVEDSGAQGDDEGASSEC